MQPRTLFIVLALFTACGSPQKAFDNQDYEKAYKLSLSDISKGKGDKETRTVLQQSLENLLEQQGSESRRLAGSSEPEDWKAALDINTELQNKIGEALVFLPNSFEKERYVLPQQAQSLRKRLFSYYFEQGKGDLARAESTGLKQYAQHAHGAFTKARFYAETRLAELDSLTQLAFKKGIIYYKVEIDAPFDITYHWEINRVFGGLADMSGGFLRVAVDEPVKNADCAIEIRFNSLEIDIAEEKGDEDYNKEVVVAYQTVADTAGHETEVPAYGTVEGNVITITQTKTATWEIDVSIDGLTPNCGLSGDNFVASTRSVIRLVRTSGDQRAIPEEYLNVEDEDFMEEDDMVEQLLEDLYEQMVRAYF